MLKGVSAAFARAIHRTRLNSTVNNENASWKGEESITTVYPPQRTTHRRFSIDSDIDIVIDSSYLGPIGLV